MKLSTLINGIKIIILLPILFPVYTFSQEPNLSDVIINIAEELAADESDSEAALVYIERLYELIENPVKLNTITEDEISRLFFLSDFQVKALADYAHSTGRIISVYELAIIPGFDKETVEMMIPFIKLNNGTKMNSDYVGWKNTIITNISIKSGNNDSTSIGSPWKILTKYKFNAAGFSGGFTSEKDPGEQFLRGNPPIPDFLSAHLAFNGRGVIRKLILGDYSARFGQGTTVNTGIRTALSLTAPGYMSARDEIKPYTSTDENNFFRGVAAEFSIKNLGLTIFYSKNYSDATLGLLSVNSEDYIKSFYKAGIHSTYSLLQKKDAVSETVIGANLSYNINNLRIGLSWSENRFSLPVIPEINKPENIFAFRGNRNNLYTIYYKSLIKRILLYGEFSINEIHSYAFVQGLSFRPSDRLTINFLYRNYDPGFISFHGKGPGNNSVSGNEHGILGNFTFEAARHLFVSAGCDIYSFPWLKYRNSAPSRGVKQEIRIKYLPTEKLLFDASYNYRVSMVDKTEKPGIPEQAINTSNTFKGSVRYSLSENIKFTTRIDYKIVDPSDRNGMLLLQDLVYSFRHLPVTLWFRYCIFNTDDWDSRLYTYENDLLYSFSIPSLSGKGSRSYLMAKWRIGDFAEIRVKYGVTSLVESWMSQTNKDEIKAQFKVWF
ncbi:MAG TPA: hypothetical protein VMV77_17040 [Bacteroidales bacterium]|nr:hypothetical protein [Bacteroidales bacterium]